MIVHQRATMDHISEKCQFCGSLESFDIEVMEKNRQIARFYACVQCRNKLGKLLCPETIRGRMHLR